MLNICSCMKEEKATTLPQLYSQFGKLYNLIIPSYDACVTYIYSNLCAMLRGSRNTEPLVDTDC